MEMLNWFDYQLVFVNVSENLVMVYDVPTFFILLIALIKM
jgi:hypothetical protein